MTDESLIQFLKDEEDLPPVERKRQRLREEILGTEDWRDG